MALMFDGMACAICERPLDTKCAFVASSAFIDEPSDPLWRFSDAAMHYDCFQRWEHRREFVNKYNATMGSIVWGNGTRHHMKADGSIESVPA
jgi:hypothetical protein